MKKQRRAVQREFAFERKRKRPAHWKTPGRKQRPERAGFVKHGPRGPHDPLHPVHVVMRCVPRAPQLRQQMVVRVIGEQLRRAIVRGIRVLHYSIQGDHLHLLVEALDATRLARGMQWLFSRVAFEVNRVARRTGQLFRDRHFRHALTNPSQMRRALVYVLMNGRKHRAQRGASLLPLYDWLDPCSSTAWLERWHADDRPPPEVVADVRAGPLPRGAPPTTWLARTGWWQRGGGVLRFGEMPSMKLV